MICSSKIGFTEGIDPTKSKNTKECIVSHYWYQLISFSIDINIVISITHRFKFYIIESILITLLLLLLKVMIIVVLFMALTNLK